MRFGRMGSPSAGWSTGSLVWRPRILGRAVPVWGAMWSTTKTAAGRSSGRSATNRLNASTPPAEAPTTMMSCRGMAVPLVARWDGAKPTPVSARVSVAAPADQEQAEDGRCSHHHQPPRLNSRLAEPADLPLGLEAGADLVADGVDRLRHVLPGALDVFPQLICCLAHATSSFRVSTVCSGTGVTV